jgi:hypothetical protein
VPFCLLVLDHPEFVNGNFNINFVEKYWDELQQVSRKDRETFEVIAAAIAYNRDNKTTFDGNKIKNHNQLPQLSPWKMRALKEMMRAK